MGVTSRFKPPVQRAGGGGTGTRARAIAAGRGRVLPAGRCRSVKATPRAGTGGCGGPKGKGRSLWGPAFRGKAPGDDLLLHGLGHTTIGAAAFHFRVRDGIGWFHSAMVARERVEGRSGCVFWTQLCAHALIGWEVANGCFVSIDVLSRVKRLEVI